MDINKYLIWLSMIDYLTPKEKLELVGEYNIKNLWELDKSQIFNVLKNNEKVELFFKNRNKDVLEKHLEYICKNNIKIISIKDENYPKILKNIYDAPIALYAKGNLSALKSFGFAMIGARNASEYGIKVAKNISYNLSKCGFNIISGLAKGIDSYSHIGAINAGGLTTAVIGTGLDTIYPKENAKLYKDIIEKNGLIITEYALGKKLKPINFPARNRIISGLSIGILIVEASIKSGSLITADFAIEQGKNVYAIPRKYNKP